MTLHWKYLILPVHAVTVHLSLVLHVARTMATSSPGYPAFLNVKESETMKPGGAVIAIEYYVLDTNRRQGLYWVYKREARGRVAPEGRALIKPI